jgi:hypothetical protein
LLEDLDGILNVSAPVRLNEDSEDAYHNNPSLGGHFASATLVDQKKVRVYIHRKLDSLALASIELAHEVKFGIVKKVPDFQPERFCGQPVASRGRSRGMQQFLFYSRRNQNMSKDFLG